MSSIAVITNRNRGYARLGPNSEPYIRGFAGAMERVGYEHQIQSGDVWMRYSPRRTGGFPQTYARVLATLLASSGGWDTSWAKLIDKRYDSTKKTASLQDCRSILNDVSSSPDHTFLHGLDTALFLVGRPDRETFIQQDFMPAFRTRYPAGRVIFVASDSQFESRLPLLRQGNYYQINGNQSYEDMRTHGINSPGTAKAFHTSGVLAIENALTVLMGNFLPLRVCMVGRGVGWRAIYLFGHSSPPVIDRGPFPREELELQIPQFFLRGDDPYGFAADEADPIGAWGGRYRNTTYPGDDAAADLLEFFIDRFNAHAANRIEVCNYTDGDDIDFVSCFEKYLTIDRIFLESIMVATATNPAAARLMAFAVLDKFQELCEFNGVSPDRNFHYFCTRPFLANVLLPAFTTLPPPWNGFFSDAATRLYDDLYSAVRSDQGVWPNYLVQSGGGVLTYRKWDKNARQFINNSVPLTDDEFVSEYVRSARNTHHGYVSNADKRRRFACYGSISTGYIPDSFTQLPLLITLADVITPRALSGHCWLDQSALTLF
jgi:hypothetical protein